MYTRQRCVFDRKPRKNYIHLNSQTLKPLRRYLRAFVEDWSKEFHFKERLHLLINYNRDRHIHVDIQVPKNMVHVPTYVSI